jgi:hypothetical protein
MTIRNTQIATIPTQIFIADQQQAITTMVFCNVSTLTTTVSVFAVPFGSNAGITTQIINEVEIPPTETFVMDTERLVLEDNDAIFAQSSLNNGITATISSVSTQ